MPMAFQWNSRLFINSDQVTYRMCLHLSFLVLSGRNESTSFSLFNQFLMNVFRKVLSTGSLTGIKHLAYVEAYTNTLKLQEKKITISFESLFSARSSIYTRPTEFIVLQLGQTASPLLKLHYYCWLLIEKKKAITREYAEDS